MAVPLLLDTDVGDDVDDVFAILLAACHPDLALAGVTTVLGDTPHRARLARHLLDLAGRPDVPVAAGTRRTLSGRTRGEITLSGRDAVGRKGSPLWDSLGDRLCPQDGVELLIEQVLGAPEPPVLAAVGPLTNVAEAFRRAPELPRRLRAVIVAGGRLGPDAERGDYNLNWDPPAARIVFESGAPLRVGTVEVIERAKLTAADVARLRAGAPACRAAAEQLALHFAQRRRTWTSLYDPLALSLAYTDRFLRTRRMTVALHTAHERAWLAPLEPAPAGGDGQRAVAADVSDAADPAAFVEHLLTTIGA